MSWEVHTYNELVEKGYDPKTWEICEDGSIYGGNGHWIKDVVISLKEWNELMNG